MAYPGPPISAEKFLDPGENKKGGNHPMRNLKKFLALALAMVMCFSLMLTASAADPASPADFDDKDEISSTYAEAVNVLSALDIIQGDDLGNFNPKNYIRRSEVSAMIYRIATSVADGQVSIYKDYDYFDDVDSEAWFAGYVNYCGIAQYVKGKTPTTFDPWANVTGYEVLAMILRVVGYDRNDEFTGPTWKIRTASTAKDLGILKNVSEGTLGQPATREVVAELLFQAMQVPTVDYNILQNYYPNKELIADTKDNRDNYANAISKGLLKLPLNADLLYTKFDIVGKSPRLAWDDFGRPSTAWVKDVTAKEDAATAGEWSQYIPNDVDTANDVGTTNEDFTDKDETPILIPMTPVKVYDNAITECNLTKEINSDKSIAWANIGEVLNGEYDDTVASVAFNAQAATDGRNTFTPGRSGDMDALHTTVDYIGATGRTTEIYKFSLGGTTKWMFVYIDTFLGEVTSTTDAIKDTAGHTIVKAKATVALGNDATGGNSGDPLKTLTLDNPNGKYKKGDLVLIQTPKSTITTLDKVDTPERAPLAPEDVPNVATMFDDDAVILTTAPTKVQVTINATVGEKDAKMGIIGSDGKTYMASNTFLAARNGTTKKNDTVLDEWYDVPNGDKDTDDATAPNKGIVNSMIGRTYDLVLDQNGYIVGMKEVLTVSEPVGVITGVESVRVASGKWVSEVEAYMVDGSTKTFQLLKPSKQIANDHLETYSYYTNVTEADEDWNAASATTGFYGKSIGVGSLVMFSNISHDGKTYWKIEDFASDAANDTAFDGTTVGTVNGDADDDTDIKTGVTDTFAGGTSSLDDGSVVFVTEYEYRYNTGDLNEGKNINKTYKVYEGFKNMPTIKAANGKAVFQQLKDHPAYVLIGTSDVEDEYIIKNQEKITVDDSYLVLSRGATYAEYSEYIALKNGEKVTLKVSNANASLNAKIEGTMTFTANGTAGADANELLVVTGTNAKGYITGVSTVSDLAGAGDSVALANCGGITAFEKIAPANGGTASAVTYADGVLTCVAGEFLTVDDNCVVKIVNRDLGTVYDSNLSEAMRYAQGIDKAGGTTDGHGQLASHGLVFELNELGYVSALYVIDEWQGTQT